jgi:hypothetical protein
MAASAIIAIPKLTVNGTAARVREIIQSERLHIRIKPAGHRIHHAWDKVTQEATALGSAGLAGVGDLTAMVGIPGSPGALAGMLGGVDEVGDGDTVEIEVNRTYGVTEAEVACSLYLAIHTLRRAERDEVVFGAALGYGIIGRLVQQIYARIKLRSNQTLQMALLAQQTALEQAKMVEEQAQLAAAAAQAAAVEAQKQAQKAAAAAKAEALRAAKEAQDIAASAALASKELAAGVTDVEAGTGSPKRSGCVLSNSCVS